MLELPLCSKLTKLPTDEIGPIIGYQDIWNTMLAELHFYELDDSCIRDLSDRAYLNKIGVIIN